MKTLLWGARGTGALTAVSLPQTGLRFDLPLLTTDGAHGDALLFAEDLDLLHLPLADGKLILSTDADHDLLPPPDRAMALGEDRVWRDEDVAPWAKLRMAPRPCVEITSNAVDLGLEGNVIDAVTWSPTELLVLTERESVRHMFVVTETGATRVETSFLTNDRARMVVDGIGHLWLAQGSEQGGQVRLVEVDREFRVKQEHTLTTTVAAPIFVQAVVIGDSGGRRELFAMFYTDSADGPRPHVFHWLEGDAAIVRLPWPEPGEALSPCVDSGIYRHYLEWLGPGDVAFMYRVGGIVRSTNGAFSRERISTSACGGTVLDDHLADGALALMVAPVDVTRPPDTPRIFARERGAWAPYELGFSELSGLELTSWSGRVIGGGDAATIVEIGLRRGGGVRLCPTIALEATDARVRGLTKVGDALVATIQSAMTRVHWIRLK